MQASPKVRSMYVVKEVELILSGPENQNDMYEYLYHWNVLLEWTGDLKDSG